jgi:hypothetical protein
MSPTAMRLIPFLLMLGATGVPVATRVAVWEIAPSRVAVLFVAASGAEHAVSRREESRVNPRVRPSVWRVLPFIFTASAPFRLKSSFSWCLWFLVGP